MVIQANMSPKEINVVWEDTAPVFKKYNIALTEKSLEELVNDTVFILLLEELNEIAGSSAATCIEGG